MLQVIQAHRITGADQLNQGAVQGRCRQIGTHPLRPVKGRPSDTVAPRIIDQSQALVRGFIFGHNPNWESSNAVLHLNLLALHRIGSHLLGSPQRSSAEAPDL